MNDNQVHEERATEAAPSSPSSHLRLSHWNPNQIIDNGLTTTRLVLKISSPSMNAIRPFSLSRIYETGILEPTSEIHRKMYSPSLSNQKNTKICAVSGRSAKLHAARV